jgi:hypothetical protein
LKFSDYYSRAAALHIKLDQGTSFQKLTKRHADTLGPMEGTYAPLKILHIEIYYALIQADMEELAGRTIG